jgi:hypothetical protein
MNDFTNSLFTNDNSSLLPKKEQPQTYYSQDSLFDMIRDRNHSPLGPSITEVVGSEDIGLQFHPISSEYKDLSLLEILDLTADEWLVEDKDEDVDEDVSEFMRQAVAAHDDTKSSFTVPYTLNCKRRSRHDDDDVADPNEFLNDSSEDSFDSLVSQVTLEVDDDDDDAETTEQSLEKLLTENAFDTQDFRSYQTGQWATRYNELLHYRALKGHCVVPHNYMANLELARWVKRQRYQYKLLQEGKVSSMTEERAAALGSIGFVWDSQGATWRERLNDLISFRLKHNHCNVPSNFHDRQLASWVKCQRRQFKIYTEGKRSNMTPERIQELEEICFEWMAPRSFKKQRC